MVRTSLIRRAASLNRLNHNRRSGVGIPAATRTLSKSEAIYKSRIAPESLSFG
jgi:hypothetical protein